MTTNKKPTTELDLAATAATELFTTPLAQDRGDADTVIAATDAAGPTPPYSGAPGAPAEQRPAPGPRIRWAAIVWGLLFTAIAAGTLLTLLSTERRDAFATWAVSLSPTTVTLYALLTVGALVLVVGLIGLLRRAQRRLARA